MRTSLNPLMYKDWEFERKYTTPGTYTLTISPGRYTFVARGGGGAGAENGGNSVTGDQASPSYGGAGGCGGKGTLVTNTINIRTQKTLTIYVGNGGKTFTNGGNGGPGGTGTAANGGAGGGGGEPSYINDGINGGLFMHGAGGGGGGGGGGAAQGGGRYSPAWCSGGGGGGGKYYLWRNPANLSYIRIDSEPGKSGGNGIADASTAGVDGDTTDWPNLYGGHGAYGGDSAGNTKNAQPGGRGAGAGGGGGGAHASSHHYVRGGCGGGGAGGDDDAGGGITPQAGTDDATNPSNSKTTPTDVTAANANAGMPGEYGRGGPTNTNGNAGFVYIKRTGWV